MMTLLKDKVIIMSCQLRYLSDLLRLYLVLTEHLLTFRVVYLQNYGVCGLCCPTVPHYPPYHIQTALVQVTLGLAITNFQ